jgi:hypothetical protein
MAVTFRTRRALGIAIASCGVYAACGSQPATSERRIEPGEGAPPPLVPTPAANESEAGSGLPRRRGCIRGGYTPAEVRAALGEPDSIAGGWWTYGRTQVVFGYGTLQDYIDGSDLVTC